MKSRNKKRGRVETDKLIIAIIVVVVIVIVIAGLVKFGVIEKLDKLLPSFLKINQSYEYVPCPPGSVDIGYIDGNNYINMHGIKTKLYIDKGILRVDVPWDNDYNVGSIDNEDSIITRFSEIEEREPEYRNLFPSKEDRELLHISFINEGTLCLSIERYNKIQNENKCIITCSLVDGICSKTPVLGKILYKQLNCPEGEECYVDESEIKLSSENLIIRDESYFHSLISAEPYNTPKVIIKEITKKNSIPLIIPERDQMWIWMKYSIPFCYAFDTTNPDLSLAQGYRGEKDDNVAIGSGRFSFSGDKFMQFIAWNDEKKEKVIFRLKLNSEGLGQKYKKNPDVSLESNDGLIFSKNVYYTYEKNKGWLWALNNEEWHDYRDFESYQGEAVILNLGEWKESTPWVNKKNKEFIKTLETKNCIEGMKALIDKVAEDSENLVLTKASLVIHRGENSEIFDSDNEEEIKKLCSELEKSEFESSDIIKDEEFLLKIVDAPVGSALFVFGLDRAWEAGWNPFNRKSEIKRTYDYMIMKNSKDRISIYTHDRQTKVWHELYCNKAKAINLNFKYSMLISSAGDTLSKTLDKNCMWSF